MHPYAEFVNPHLGQLLAAVRLNKRFVRGEGPWLWDSDGRRYLDFIAAYGALPFGYNPPHIWAALSDVQAAGEPSFVQPSYLEAAGELARRLIELAPAGLRY
ncbi:MAG: aminotransferase class III-fold pyridoxal phosphate-dependent enzyme, partial [Limnochordales bacterium]